MELDAVGRYHDTDEDSEAAVTGGAPDDKPPAGLAPGVRLPVPDALGFLRGRWRVERRLADHVTGTHGTFAGTAVFADSGPATLEYHEQGELHFGTYRGEASRRLRYCGRPDGTADVFFADGRAFYHLDPRAGQWQGEHPCGRDHYTLTARWLGARTFREHWQVRGPAKDYEIITTLTRAAAPASPARSRP